MATGLLFPIYGHELAMAPDASAPGTRFKARDYQQRGIDEAFRLFESGTPGVIFRQPTGCHARGQGILMFDGSVRPVERVRVGDLLMGPDSRPRLVVRLCRGRGEMVRIVPTKGASFVVNVDHVLTLIKTGESRGKEGGRVLDVTVREWLAWPKSRKHVWKLFRVGVDFAARQSLPIEPYFLGLLLGDGGMRHGSVGVTTADVQVADEVYRQARMRGLEVRAEGAGGRSVTFYPGLPRGRRRDRNGQFSTNPLIDQLRRLMLKGAGSGNKFIPHRYLTASRQDRLELLAGLVDSDGSETCNGFDFVSKSRRLAWGVAFLARSVGLAAYTKDCRKVCGNTGAVGIYWRVSISGNCDSVPCRIARKRCRPRRQKKDVLRTGFRVERMGEDDYYGFSLSGDGRFLLDDFTVTHNTGKTVSGALIAHRWLQQGDDYRVMVLAHERQLVHQFAEEITDVLGVVPGIEMADERVSARNVPPIVVASRATLQEKQVDDGSGEVAQASRLYKFDWRLNWLVIVDECHRYKRSMKSCRHLFDWFERNPRSRRLGLTATPERSDRVSLAGLFPGVASDYRLYDLDGGPSAVNDGWAVPYDQRFVTVEGVDFKTLREVSGDFDESELELVLGQREKLLSLVRPTLDLVEHRRTIVFSPTVDMAKRVAHTINEFVLCQCERCGARRFEHGDELRLEPRPVCRKCGGPLAALPHDLLAKSLDGSYPDQARKEVYAQHQRSQFQFLSVCGLCIAKGTLVMTDQGEVPIERLTTDMRLWDGVEFVAHGGVIWKGQKPVIRYAGLIATGDHNVWTDDGWQQLAACKQRGIAVRVSAIGGRAVRESDGYYRDDRATWQESAGRLAGAVRWLRGVVGQGVQRTENRPVWVQALREAVWRSRVAVAALSVREEAMRESARRVLSRLRWSWDRVSVCFAGGHGFVDHAKPWFAPGADAGPAGQQSPLRAWKPALGQPNGAGEQPSATAEVFDILNAGPRHRFTANGLIVSNCREGYNDPGIQAVAVFRPTKSRALAEQMKGRGCRPLRGLVDGCAGREERLAAIAASDKPNCMIVDLVGVTGLADCASTAHILGQGKPDEVIERANRNAATREGPVDMAQEIRQAERELAAERQAREDAKRRREEREAQLQREREEAARLRKLRGDVRYDARQVNQGHGVAGSRERRKGPCMPFGKHKGKPLEQISSGYLRAIGSMGRLPSWLRESIARELAQRAGRMQAQAAERRQPAAAGAAVATGTRPATDGQLRVLARFGRATEGHTFESAAAAIGEINRLLRKH